MAKKKILSDLYHSVFCTQCAMIYENGLPVEEGLILLSEQDSIIDFKSILNQYKVDNDLLRALKDTNQFDDLFLSSFEVATQIGKEESILKHLSNFYLRKSQNKNDLKELLTLPFILFSILIIILNVLSLVILPIFQSIFINLGGSYPLWINVLMKSLNIISSVGLISLVLFVFWAVIISIRKVNHPEKEDVIDLILGFIPKSVYKSDLAYFTFLVEIMMESGVSHHTALSLVFDHLPKRDLYRKLKSVHLDENDNLIDLILKADIYPSFAQNSIRLAYKSGNLESTLRNISISTQVDSEKVIEKAFSRIEPIVLVFLAFGVGSVLLSLIIPLLQAMQTLGF